MRPEVLHYLADQLPEFLAGSGSALNCCAGGADYDLNGLCPGYRFQAQDQFDFPEHPMDYVCDIHDLDGVPDDTFDLLTCLEALEHVAEPGRAVRAMGRVLKEGGLAAFTTVMDFPIHRHPHDYWRFCPEGLASILDGFRILDFTIEGRREKPQGLWVIARREAGCWREHNLDRANNPKQVHNGLTRWFAFKEEMHYRIARLFFAKRARKPPRGY